MVTIYDNDEQYRRSETDANLEWIPEWHGNRRIGLAIIGVGRMGAIHLQNTIREPRANTLYIVDVSQQRLNYMRRKYYLDERNIAAVTIDKWDQVLRDERVEALLISTPTLDHERYVSDGLKHGKHIICEKPLAKKTETIMSMVELARSKNLKLICAFNRRYDRSFRRIKEQVERGDVGAPRIIKTCSRDSPLPPIEYIRTSGGLFHDCGVHDVDATLWIAKELPVEVHAYAHTYSEDYKALDDFDTVVFTMRFQSGLLSMTDLSRLSVSGYEQRFEVFGPKGVLKIDEFSEATWEKHTEKGVTRPNQCYSFASRFHQAYATELLELFNHIEGFKTLEPINHKYLPALCKIVNALELSARSGLPVKLEWTAEEDCFLEINGA